MHEAFRVRGPHGVVVEIDREMVTLMRILWHMGFVTQFSCQGGPPYKDGHGRDIAYIVFEGREAASSFFAMLGYRALPVIEYTEEAYSQSMREDVVFVETDVLEAGWPSRGIPDGPRSIARFPYQWVRTITEMIVEVHVYARELDLPRR